MSNSDFATDGTLNVKFDRRTTTPEFPVGTIVTGNKNRAWVYVLASENVATGTCTVSTDGNFTLTDTGGNYTADTAFVSGEYGWVRKTAAAF